MKWTKDQGAAKSLIEFLMDRANYIEWLTFSGLGAYPAPRSISFRSGTIAPSSSRSTTR